MSDFERSAQDGATQDMDEAEDLPTATLPLDAWPRGLVPRYGH